MNKSTIDKSENSHTVATKGNGKPATLTSQRKSKRGLISTEDHGENNDEAHWRQLLSAIIAFRDGDFSVRLPADWEGTEGRIAEALNQVISQEDRIAQEVTRLSVTVGKE